MIPIFLLKAENTFKVYKRVLTALRAPVFLGSLIRKKRRCAPTPLPPIAENKYYDRARNLTRATNNVIARKRIRQ
jgi:hypothetical protein